MKSESRHIRGFTLIELLVTVSIFVFMTALIIARYGSFNQGTLMTDLAYDVALSIRTAQTYGVSVKGTEITSSRDPSQTFNYPYAVHFDQTTSIPATFFTYLDIGGTVDGKPNGVYDGALDGESHYSDYVMKQGAKISSLCVGTGQTCTVSGLNSLDVSFRRPDPSAILCPVGGSSIQCVNGVSSYNYAEIKLTSGDGSSSRTVVVRGNGQISVNMQ